MVTVKKDFDLIPDGLNDDNHKEKLRQAIKENITHEFDSATYKKASVDSLKKNYNNKCAYCETNGESGYYAEVEHYRPKKGKIKDGHSGYYWLGYEWSNLILCCSKCNKKKSSQFPVAGNRVVKPILDGAGLPTYEYTFIKSNILLAEKPLLLNPEIDNPGNHLIVLPDGLLKNITNQGIETIKICNLNRNELVLRRRKKIENFFNSLKALYSEYLTGEIKDDELKRNIIRLYKHLFSKLKNDTEFSLVWYMLATKFDLFSKYYLQTKEYESTVKYYNEFKEFYK